MARVTPPADTGSLSASDPGTPPAAVPTDGPAPRVSVVLATYNRLPTLLRLLRQLGEQTFRDFEVVVVDDGSREPVAPHLQALGTPFKLTLIAQQNAGAAAARHRGVLAARGEILVLLDDDMQLPAVFLEEHLRWHEDGTPRAVFGRYRSDPNIANMPLFERWYADKWDAWSAGFSDGSGEPTGIALCTGNVSMRRQDYLSVGGFNLELDRSEDAELGLKLEQHGVQFVYSEDAYTLHGSDHTRPEVWIRRAYRYGICDVRIGRMHPRILHADPWRFWYSLSPLSRPVLWTALAAPQLSKPLARATMRAALAIDKLGARRPALRLCGAVYGMEYYRGVRDECGGYFGSQRALREFLVKTVSAGKLDPEAPKVRALWFKALADLDADFGWYENRYSHWPTEKRSFARDIVEKVGLQIAAGYRLMSFFRDADLPLAAKLTSRMLRHAYGSDIHWEASIAPGVMFVHGMGLAIHSSAKIGPRCVIAQNVTLGLGLDPETRQEGAPTIEANVRIGAGATLLGPITVGEGSKIMPGVVLTHSVPKNTLVEAPVPTLRRRKTDAGGEPERDGKL